jgi:Na+/H+-dicarboxylate symporter
MIRKLHWQILIAILLGTVAGIMSGQEAQIFGIRFYDMFSFVGELFLNALKMIIVPLISASIITGASNLGGANLGRLGGKTLAFYMFSSAAAILIGLLMVNAFSPGLVDGKPLMSVVDLDVSNDTAAIAERIEGRGGSDIVDVFIRMVPPNVVAAAADGQMLGLIFFSLLFGAMIQRVEDPYRTSLINFWQGVFRVMMEMTMLVMRFAPLGVFGLVAKTMAVTGFDVMLPLAWFFITVLLALALHALVLLPMLLLAVARVNPLRHIQAMGPALLTAFSTASSSATLPLTIECVEKGAGVSQRTSSFVLPLGATVNMDGTALYECVAAIFLAQAYGVDLSFAQQFLIVVIALLTSIGVAGIPAASLVAISIILAAVGVPLEGIGLLMVTDRILDMLRTAVNVFSDSCCAVVIASSEGEILFSPDDVPELDRRA